MTAHTKLVAALLVLCSIVWMAAGCASGSPPATPNASVASPASTPVVRVAVIPFSGTAPIYVAAQERRCDSYGIQLEVIEVASQNALDAVMAKGEVEVGAYANTSLAFAASAGLPLRAFLAIDLSLGADGVAVAGNVNSVQDMVDQQTRFGADETDVPYFVFMAAADTMGLKPGDFNHVQIGGGDALSAFLTGNVDAVGISDPLLHQALQREGAHILLTSRDYPGYVSDVFAAAPSVVESQAEALTALARCWYDTIDRVTADPDSAISIMAQRLQLDEAKMRELMPGILWPDLAQGRQFLLEGDLYESLRFTNDFYGQLNQLTGNPVPPEDQVSDIIVNRLP